MPTPYAVQYDEDGNITATVSGFHPKAPPDHPRQIILDDVTDLTGKKVNVKTKKLVDAPAA